MLAEVVEGAVTAAHHRLDVARAGVRVPEAVEMVPAAQAVHGPRVRDLRPDGPSTSRLMTDR